MASIILPLAMTGSRKADGTANAGGRVYLSLIGSPNSSVTGYLDRDKNAAATLSGGGYVLDQAGKIALFIDTACRVRTEDTNGAAVDSYVYEPVLNEGLVEVDSPGFTGVSPTTGSLVAGGRTTLAAVLQSLYASTGGLDGKYRGVYGTADTNIKAEIEQIFLTPQRFGAIGNGIADDTTALQAMANAQTASGIPVFFPRGTYKITSAITFGSSAVITGTGRGSTTLAFGSIINIANTAQDGFIVGANSIIEDIGIVSTVVCTGTALKIAGLATLVNVGLGSLVSGGTFATCGNNTTGTSHNTAVLALGCSFSSTTTSTVGSWVLGYCPTAAVCSATTTVLLEAGSPTGSFTAYNTNSASMANGGNVTPAVNGSPLVYQKITGTSAGGGAVNVAAPPTYSGNNGTGGTLVLDCLNSSGGAFLFTLAGGAGGYKAQANPNPTNGLRIVVTFQWSSTDSLWIETSRVPAFTVSLNGF